MLSDKLCTQFFTFFSLLFIAAVSTSQRAYPPLLLLVCPGILFVLRKPLINYLPDNLMAIVDGGYSNRIMMIFFIAATIALGIVKAEGEQSSDNRL